MIILYWPLLMWASLWGSLGSSGNWLEPKTNPLGLKLASSNLWNAWRTLLVTYLQNLTVLSSHYNNKITNWLSFFIFQNWRRAHKKRVLFKLGSTLVGEIDVIEERNNNDDNDDGDVKNDVIMSDGDDDDDEADAELPTRTNPTTSSSSPTPSTSSSRSDEAGNSRASVYDEILHDEDWRWKKNQSQNCYFSSWKKDNWTNFKNFSGKVLYALFVTSHSESTCLS